jgi:hypothetical protein
LQTHFPFLKWWKRPPSWSKISQFRAKEMYFATAWQSQQILVFLTTLIGDPPFIFISPYTIANFSVWLIRIFSFSLSSMFWHTQLRSAT